MSPRQTCTAVASWPFTIVTNKIYATLSEVMRCPGEMECEAQLARMAGAHSTAYLIVPVMCVLAKAVQCDSLFCVNTCSRHRCITFQATLPSYNLTSWLAGVESGPCEMVSPSSYEHMWQVAGPGAGGDDGGGGHDDDRMHLWCWSYGPLPWPKQTCPSVHRDWLLLLNTFDLI